MAAVDHSEPVAHSLSSDSTYIAQMEAGATADATRLISKITETSLGQRWNPCLTLENSGSVARDHLASERTFLAYARTSLAIAGTGVALVQLFTISTATSNQKTRKYTRPLGATIIVLGMVTLFIGVLRYFSVQNALTKGSFPVARFTVGFLALMLIAVVVVVFGILVAAIK